MIFQIPIFCAQCNTVYSSGIALGAGATIGIENSVSQCPRGHMSPIPDGTFQVRDGVLQITTASGSESVLQHIRRLASDAISGKTEADEAIKAIEALAPSLSPILKLIGKNNSLLALALLLWFIVEMTKVLNPGGTGASKPIHIENRPTIINQITVDKGISAHAELSPTDRGVTNHKNQDSKRKKRRLRGKHRPHGHR
jgi:hypothetical protein